MTIEALEAELLKVVPGVLVALVTLGLGWFVGQRFAVKWNLFQKRRETDIANVQQFHLLYGEYKEISKLWRVMKRKGADLAVPADGRWSLLARSCAVESKSEAIMLKLATERSLAEHEKRRIGLFRQALQTLRESIRDDKEIPSASRGADYVYFNELAAQMTIIISSSAPLEKAQQNAQTAIDNLEAIANVRWMHFHDALKQFRESHPELDRTDGPAHLINADAAIPPQSA